MSNLKAYKYRLYPTKKQAEKLQWTLDRTRELYNAALQERRDAYEMLVKRHPNYHDELTRKELAKAYARTYSQQSAQLPEIKALREEYRDIHSQVLQDVLQRVKKAFDSFFRRVRKGKKPGYPRFQGYGRYNSFTFPQSGFSLTEDHRVCLSKIGTLKIKLHRPIEGTIKTCTVKREGRHWSIIFTCEVEQEMVYHPSEAMVGIDLGLVHFGTLSDGSMIENSRHMRYAEHKLKKGQAALVRKKRGSKRRRKAAQRVGKIHQHIPTRCATRLAGERSDLIC